MIDPSEINPRQLALLREWLVREIRLAQSDRLPLEKKWDDWLTSYRAHPNEKKKNFPFHGASNLTVSVIATDVESIHSWIMGQLFAPDNLWSCTALRPDTVDFAMQLQRLLQWSQENELDAYNAIADWTLELCKLGTSVIKTRYERRMQEVYEWRETPEGLYQAEKLVWLKDNPRLHHTSIYNFLVPASCNALQEAPWCSERLMLSWGQLVERVQNGVYGNPFIYGQPLVGINGTLDPLATWWWMHDRGGHGEEKKQKLDRVVPSFGDKFEVYEVWTRFDIKGNGRLRAIKAVLHLPSQTFIDISWNPFFNQEYPFDVARYLRQEGRFYGIGICEMGEQSQIEISTMHNQRIDNATVLNTSMFKALKTSGIKQNEPIYAGKIWLLDNMDDLQPFFSGQKLDSTIPNENMVLTYLRQRTAVSDYTLGNNTASTGYAAATTTIEMFKAGAKRRDQTMREIREALKGVGMKVVELYQQFNQGGKPYTIFGTKNGQIIQNVLTFPLDLVRMSIGIDITASSAALNQEVELRTNTIVYEMLQQYGQQVIQGMTLYINPQVPPPLKNLIGQLLLGGNVIMKRVIEGYGVPDVDQVLPDLKEVILAGAQPIIQPGFGAPGFSAGNGANPPAGLIGIGSGPAAGSNAGAGLAGLSSDPMGAQAGLGALAALGTQPR